MPGVGRLVAKHEAQRFAGRVLREKRTVASEARGVVESPSYQRGWRVLNGARSALP
jgi:hypothetical protein